MTEAAVAAPVASPTATAPPASPTPATGVEGQGAQASAVTPASTPDTLSVISDTPSVISDAPKSDKIETQITEQPTEFNLKVPENASTVSKELLTEFTELAKSEKLSPEAAQKIVDFAPKLGERIALANKQAWDTMVQDWQGAVKNDPEIGGPKLEGTLSTISKAIDTYAPKEKEALLNAFRLTGAGSEPNIVKFIARLSQQVSEPKFLPGGGPVSKQSKGASALYPTMAKEA